RGGARGWLEQPSRRLSTQRRNLDKASERRTQHCRLRRPWLGREGGEALAEIGRSYKRGGGISRHGASTSNHKAPLMRSGCLWLTQNNPTKPLLPRHQQGS